MADVGAKVQSGFGPPQKMREEADVLNEYIERLKEEVKPPDVYTLDGLIAKMEAILADAKKDAAFRRAQKATPYDPDDD